MLRSDLQFRKVIFYGENNRGQDGGLGDEVLRHGGERKVGKEHRDEVLIWPSGGKELKNASLRK